MSATEPTSIASARKASSVLGPPVMLAHSTSMSRSSIARTLEGHLRGRVADAEHGAVGGLVGEGGGELELRPGLGAAAGGQGQEAGGGQQGGSGQGAGAPSSWHQWYSFSDSGLQK